MKKLLLSILILLTSFTVVPTTVKAQECGTPVPPAPTKVRAVSGPSSGQVTLYWDAAPYANRYAVAYGTTSGKYMYGANNIGGEKSRSYTVKHLQPGTKYYFKLAAARDCSSSPFSVEVSAVARGGQVAVAPTTAVTSVTPAVRTGQPIVSTTVSSGPVGKQKLTATTAGIGQVTLRWQDADSADNYHLVYGSQAGKYEYGALNIGKINKFTVKHLVPGKAYYFAIVPVFNNQSLYTTAAVKAYAGAPAVEVVQTTKEAVMMPKATYAPPIGTTNPSVEIPSPIPTEATSSAPIQ